MVCLSLVLFCLACFAGDVVELEPVRSQTGFSSSTNVTCSLITTGATDCIAAPGCAYPATECITDPCLKFSNDSTDFASLPNGCGIGMAKAFTSLSNDPGSNCVNWGTGDLPAGGGKDFYIQWTGAPVLDRCSFGYLFNGSCPKPGCWKVDTVYGQKCVEVGACQAGKKSDHHWNITDTCACLNALLTYDTNACTMDPRCYKNGAGACVRDPCLTTWVAVGTTGHYFSDPIEPSGGTCSGTCVAKSIKYKTGDGNNVGEKEYCFSSGNTPNKCFYLQGATAQANGQCPVGWNTQNNHCTNVGEECAVQTIEKDYYGWTNLCTDAEHGSPGSSKVLVIPSVLALLLLSFLL